MTKYLFCYPFGGINNVLEIIWRCSQHCQKYNRTLVVDSRYVATFRDDIRKYLIFPNDMVYSDDIDILYESLKNKPIYPNIFANSRQDYKTIIKNLKFTKNGYISKDTNISINLGKDYPEDIILFANCIGGTGILHIFKVAQLSYIVKNEIVNRLKKLPDDFISIHIRNTDRKSDVNVFLETNHDNFKDKNIFVASDSLDAIQIIISKYTPERVYTFSNIPGHGKPIHENNINLNKEDFIIECLSDLIVSCFGKEYYYSCQESGYSKNILLLRKNMDIINKRVFEHE